MTSGTSRHETSSHDTFISRSRPLSGIVPSRSWPESKFPGAGLFDHVTRVWHQAEYRDWRYFVYV